MTLPADVVAALRELKVSNPNPANRLHADLVETFQRLRGEPGDVVTIALQWCYQAEMERQGAKFATRKTEYDRALGRAIVKYRTEGERSAEVASHRAHAENDDVYQAHLDYRLAEQMLAAAKSGLGILSGRLSTWQTNQAAQRSADAFIARTNT